MIEVHHVEKTTSGRFHGGETTSGSFFGGETASGRLRPLTWHNGLSSDVSCVFHYHIATPANTQIDTIDTTDK